jgi:hypothetical protein
MNPHGEPLAHLLGRLPDADPHTRRRAAVRARCHAALARRTRAARRRPSGRLESVCVFGLCIAYLATVVVQAMP